MAFGYMMKMYNKLREDVKKGDYTLMDEMHHLTSGMKSVYTQTCFDGLLQLRQACGGAGYSAWSGLPYLIDDFSPNVTLEGDNTVMAQQSFNFLQKLYLRGQKGEAMPSEMYSYLSKISETLNLKCKATTAEDFCNLEQVEEALRVATSYSLQTVMKALEESKASKRQKMNEIHALEVDRALQAHIRYLSFHLMRSQTPELKDVNLRGHVYNLNVLSGLTFLKTNLLSAFEAGYINGSQSKLVDQACNAMLVKIRPQIIPLVELCSISDDLQPTAIGNQYGDIYETHVEWAKTSRMNDPANGSIPKGFM